MKGLTEGYRLHGKQRFDCDVVVVGSGGGGAPAAYELSKAGLTVMVLEAGKWVRPEDFTQREIDTVGAVYVDQGGQAAKDGTVGILQGECVGGSTVINGEVCFRIPDFVLEQWSGEFGVRGMSPQEMAPIFEHVERMINVTPNAGKYLEAGERISAGMTKLGLNIQPVARNVKDCRGCCYCFWGCAYGCKQSMDQSYLPAAGEAGARIVSEARVERIHFEAGHARGVDARTPHGVLEVRSRAVVIACGAIATPLLLIDNGVGGAEVGRHLAVHPVLFFSALFAEERPAVPAALLATYCRDFMDQDFLIETGGGSRAFGAAGVAGFGAEHKKRVRDELSRTWGCGAILRDKHGPGRVFRDKKGSKVIDYALDESTRKACRVAMKKLAEIGFAGGAERVSFSTTKPFFLSSVSELHKVDELSLLPADIGLVSYHPQGTARLNTVTDNDGRVRGTEDLYVMDTSVFPTPVGVNPQIPVMAVSTVLSRRLAARLGR